MKLFEFKVTEDGESTRLYVAAGNIQDAVTALADSDIGDVEWDSVTPYVDGDKRPRSIKELDDVPDDFHDSVYLGDNENEQTVENFFAED